MTVSEIKDKLLELYPKYTCVYGPYSRSDNRKHVVLCGKDSSIRRTLSWPKAKMEVKLGRKLKRNETADHIDEDVKNNKYRNLQVLSRSANASKSAVKNLSKEDFTDIFSLSRRLPYKAIAKIYGISYSYVEKIANNRHKKPL